ncbi:MAG: hypothetical protein WCT35_04890 [Sideroxydans sp.]|jgi:hypothetical protein
MAFVETLSDFINDDTPGYVSATVGGVPGIGGLFDDNYTDPLGFSGSFPALTCTSADVSTAGQGTAVVVNGVSYTVAAIKLDGTGMTLLQLAEA